MRIQLQADEDIIPSNRSYNKAVPKESATKFKNKFYETKLSMLPNLNQN